MPPSSAVPHRQPWPKIYHLPLFKQVIGFVLFSLYVITFFSLYSYEPADVSFNVYPANRFPPTPSAVSGRDWPACSITALVSGPIFSRSFLSGAP